MEIALWTFDDILYAADTFVRFSEKPSMNGSDVRLCVEEALRLLVGAAEWNSMKRTWRAHLQPTVVGVNYTYAGTAETVTDYGTTDVDREVIMSGGVWPGYESPLTTTLAQAGITILDGELRLGTYSLNCTPDNTNTSDPTTRLQLDPTLYPSEDYTTPDNLMIGFPKYPLPPDFAAGIIAAERNAWFIGTYIPPEQWFVMDKYRIFTGIVRNFTFLPDPKRYGQTALYVHPCPSVATEYDLQIKSWRRPMNLSGREPWQNTGTVTVTAGSAAVTGSGTAFDQRMVGSVLRVAYSGVQPPTGTAGNNRYLFQQTIASVINATNLTLTGPAPTFPSGQSTLTGVGYLVSDPCDVPASLIEAFKEGVYAQLARFCNPKEHKDQVAKYNAALKMAKAADNQDRSVKGVGTGTEVLSRLRDNQSRPLAGPGYPPA